MLGGESFINDSAACSDLNRRTSNDVFVRASTSGEGVNLETGSSAGHTTIVILPLISPTFFIFGVRAKLGQHMSEGDVDDGIIEYLERNLCIPDLARCAACHSPSPVCPGVCVSPPFRSLEQCQQMYHTLG